MKLRVAALAISIAGIACPAHADAILLGDPIVNGVATANSSGEMETDFGDHAGASINSGNMSAASALVGFNPGGTNLNNGVPSVAVTVFARADFDLQGFAGALASLSVQYQFVISGPPGLVPVLFSASGAGTVDNLTLTHHSIFNPGFSVTDFDSPGGGPWNIDTTLELRSGGILGALYTVLMNVQHEVIANEGSCDSPCDTFEITGESIIDPSFQIDPSFPNANLYSIQFSPGIQNGLAPSSVPLPGALAFFASGLGCLGVLSFRRKKSNRSEI